MPSGNWKRLITGGVVAAVITVVAASPAAAVERVGCGDVSDGAAGTRWFRIYEKHQTYPKMCFKNRGELNVSIHAIDMISTGNNDGWFEENNGKRTYFRHFQNHFLGGSAVVVKLHFGP